MMDREILPKDRFHEYSIQFSQIGLDYCGAKGCTVKVASSNRTLSHRIEERIREFQKNVQNFAASRNS